MEINASQADDLKKQWDDLPKIENTSQLSALLVSFLKDCKHKQEVQHAAEIYIEQFSTWRRVMMGGAVGIEDLEDVIIGEGVVLDLTNMWFKNVKMILEPVITQCKASLPIASMIKGLRATDASELIWVEYCKSWDFLPWFLFVATGDMQSFLSFKLLLSKILHNSKSDFIDEFSKVK